MCLSIFLLVKKEANSEPRRTEFTRRICTSSTCSGKAREYVTGVVVGRIDCECKDKSRVQNGTEQSLRFSSTVLKLLLVTETGRWTIIAILKGYRLLSFRVLCDIEDLCRRLPFSFLRDRSCRRCWWQTVLLPPPIVNVYVNKPREFLVNVWMSFTITEWERHAEQMEWIIMSVWPLSSRVVWMSSRLPEIWCRTI